MLLIVAVKYVMSGGTVPRDESSGLMNGLDEREFIVL